MQLSKSDEQRIEKEAEKLIDEAYNSGMHWKVVNRRKVIDAVFEMMCKKEKTIKRMKKENSGLRNSHSNTSYMA